MSRHRNVRSLRYSDEYDGYDDVYGHSLEDESCLSPGEASRWMFDRGRETLASYYEEAEPEPEPGPEPAPTPPKADDKLDGLDDLRKAKLYSCLEGVRDVLGDSIPEDAIVEAILAHDYDVPTVLDRLLAKGSEAAEGPKRPSSPVVPVAPAAPATPAPVIKIEAARPTKVIAPAPNAKIKTFRLENDPSPAGTRTPTPEPERPPRSPEPPVRQREGRADPEALYRKERRDDKEHLYVVVIGHVDAGKSTLMGRLLCDLGEVNARTLHKYEQESKKIGKQSFAYAWVLDETGEERTRGITMDVGRAQFSTKSKRITVLDAPGHADFIPNMIAGAGQADAALLVVDATTGEFESGFDLGGQTREHAVLARSLGISQLAVAVNKLDAADWSRDRFDEIKAKLKLFLKQVGFKEADVAFVPLSGLTGQNLAKPATEEALKKWYTGPSLIDAIDSFKTPERPVAKPFRMSVNDLFKGTGSGFSVAGRIETGVLSAGDRVTICPIKETAVVKSISSNDATQNVAFAGDQVSVSLSGADIQNVAVGYVLCDPSRPIPIATVFEARIVVFNVKVPITKGYPVLIHHQSLIESANIVKLKASINKSTGEIIKKKPRCLGNNSAALIDIETSKPICVEIYKDCKELGRIMLRVGGVTIAAGLITGIVK